MAGVSASADPRAAFGPEIEALFKTDAAAPGSVDADLPLRMLPLTHQTRAELYAPRADASRYRAGVRPELERFVREVTKDAIHPVQVVTALTRFCGRIPRLFPTEERSTASGWYGDFSGYLRGGAEEELIKKGCALSQERARVLCALAQVANLAGSSTARRVREAAFLPVQAPTEAQLRAEVAAAERAAADGAAG